jgi:hypothetical protein
MKSFFASFMIVCAVSLAFVPAASTHAAAGIVGVASGVVDYGGYVLSITPCPVTGLFLVTVFDWSTYTVIPTVFVPGVSAIHLDYNLAVPITYTTGQFIPVGGECGLPSVATFAPPPFQGYAAALIPFVI